MSQNEFNLETARQLDRDDSLAAFRDCFFIPEYSGRPEVYLVGNSLGLQPKSTGDYVHSEIENWRRLGVRGHFEGQFPWMPYHEFLTETMADLVGGLPDEVVVMNSLTVNLHLMMATFYRPTPRRHKILIEQHAFPSDHYAVESHIKWRGYKPQESLLTVAPAPGQELITTDQICQLIDEQQESLALVMLPGVQYYTGQLFDMQRIAEAAQSYEIPVGFDLAHAAGNVILKLHEWNADFAVWCTYKYLNSGPGSVAGCFIHRRHATNKDLGRLAGWWGHDKKTRFEMGSQFIPIPTAEGWQLSNPPILSLAAIRASLDVFKGAGGMAPLREKSKELTGFLAAGLERELPGRVTVITPSEPSERGCQLSLTIRLNGVSGKSVHQRLESEGVRTDWREPNVIRAAPVPLYNRFEDVYRFVETLRGCLDA